MCIYIIKKYFNYLHNYFFSSILSIYYDIPTDKIYKYLDYQNKSNYINSISIFKNDIDIIITEFIIGEYKIFKINNHEYPILKNDFDYDYLKNIFNNSNRIIHLKINENINKYIIDFTIIINLLYPEPLILHLYNTTNINTNTRTKIYKYNIDFIDNFLFDFNLIDFHQFIRIMNFFNRTDFNILYEYVLDNSQNLSNKFILKNIKFT